MGDRCWLSVTVRKDEEERFLDMIAADYDERYEDERTVTLEFHQANYGLGQPLDNAAGANIEFYGEHGRGDQYGASRFHSNGEGVAYLAVGEDGDGYAVSGSTTTERWASLRAIEARIVEREELIQRIHNPIYDLIKEVANG
jgi:hypothetical protein